MAPCGLHTGQSPREDIEPINVVDPKRHVAERDLRAIDPDANAHFDHSSRYRLTGRYAPAHRSAAIRPLESAAKPFQTDLARWDAVPIGFPHQCIPARPWRLAMSSAVSKAPLRSMISHLCQILIGVCAEVFILMAQRGLPSAGPARHTRRSDVTQKGIRPRRSSDTPCPQAPRSSGG